MPRGRLKVRSSLGFAAWGLEIDAKSTQNRIEVKQV